VTKYTYHLQLNNTGSKYFYPSLSSFSLSLSFSLSSFSLSFLYISISLSLSLSLYHTSLSNHLIVILLHLTTTGNSPYEVIFGNTTLTVQPHAVKLSIEVVNWPFKSFKNLLKISISVDSPVLFLFFSFLFFFSSWFTKY